MNPLMVGLCLIHCCIPSNRTQCHLEIQYLFDECQKESFIDTFIYIKYKTQIFSLTVVKNQGGVRGGLSCPVLSF